jgi:hypothetical protein
MRKIFSFGETIEEYDVPVLNEREVRASAGILFLFAFISFLNSWLVGDFSITKIFVIIFLVDFAIRILVNPKYSPSLIIGRLVVSRQKVEYVGAPQKRFAWSIGFILAVTMFYLLVIKDVIGPLNLFVCLTCLILLFFESAFGICLACIIYNLFHREKAKLCPGNICEINKKEEIQKISFGQVMITILFMFLIYGVSNSSFIHEEKQSLSGLVTSDKAESELENQDCVVPQWAIEMGHEDKWKLHHGCK